MDFEDDFEDVDLPNRLVRKLDKRPKEKKKLKKFKEKNVNKNI